MRKIAIVFLFIYSIAPAQNSDSLTVNAIAKEILQHGEAYKNLEYLCKKIGPRLSGSANAQKAVEATFNMLKAAGADTVYLQSCMVPHWVRGAKEIANIQWLNNKKSLHVCALGGSVATAANGIKAPVIEIKSFEELAAMSEENIKGKIIFYNYPMKTELVHGGYGDAVWYRWNGPVMAAQKGAVAIMIRSVTYALDDHPHTGATHYVDTVKKIPAIACSTKDAEWLSDLLKKEKHVELFIKTNCETLPDVQSFNVVGEIRGTENKDEIITCGGHLDSWDLAEGAHDDGTGCMQSIEVIRALKATGIKPKRSIRAVMFMNEENGLRGALKYAEAATAKNEKQLFAIESDEGGFGCTSIGLDGTPTQEAKLRSWMYLFKPYGALDMPDGGGGADIGSLKKMGTMMSSINPNSQRYFDHHHSALDVFESVNKRELELGAVNMAAMVWLVSEYGMH